MKKTTLLAAAVLPFFFAGAAFAQAPAYYIDGYQGSCPAGGVNGGGIEGIVSIGNGSFTVFDATYRRQSDLTKLGDGWVQAVYAVEWEGEPGEPQRIKLRITDDRVDIQDSEETYSAKRCR